MKTALAIAASIFALSAQAGSNMFTAPKWEFCTEHLKSAFEHGRDYGDDLVATYDDLSLSAVRDQRPDLQGRAVLLSLAVQYGAEGRPAYPTLNSLTAVCFNAEEIK